jgi:Anti-sigma-K factor rskA
VLIAAVVAAVALVLFLVLRGDDGSDERSASAGSAAPAATPTPGATPQVADRIRLTATSSSKATGEMTIFLQDGQLLFQLQATGVPANTKRSAYAVWFTNPGGQAHRLGFTSPVGADGKLAIQGPSEKDLADFPQLYATYRTVVVSRETSENARRPGPVLLSGRLPKGR